MEKIQTKGLINRVTEIEHCVGEIVEIDFEEWKVVESNEKFSCEECAFYGTLSCPVVKCTSTTRKDGKNIVYERL